MLQQSKAKRLHRGRRTNQYQPGKNTKDPRKRKGLGANPGRKQSQNSQWEPPKPIFDLLLVVRIARPTSLAIWHRGCSHRRPNRSGSPNRRHFASLDLKKHPDFSHRRPTSQDFRRLFFWHFPVISDQANHSECVFASLAKNLFRIASDLGVCDSNRIAHRGCIARFGPLRTYFRATFIFSGGV